MSFDKPLRQSQDRLRMNGTHHLRQKWLGITILALPALNMAGTHAI